MKKLIALSFLLMLAACSKSSTINKDFPDNRWEKSAVQTFTVDVTEESINDVNLLFSFVSGPQFTEIPVSIDVTAPDGSATLIAVTLDLNGKAADSKLDCAGDVCDLHTTVKKGIKLQKGTYTFAVKNNFKGEYLPNVLAVGVDVKAEK